MTPLEFGGRWRASPRLFSPIIKSYAMSLICNFPNQLGKFLMTEQAKFPVGDVSLTRRVQRLAKDAGKSVETLTRWNGHGHVRTGYAVDARILEIAKQQIADELARKKAKLDVLAALFTLNRRAKRCRDSAGDFYERGMHGLAGDAKREKERIYRLKGQALHYLVESGRLKVAAVHQFQGGTHAEVLEGEGYRFHRPCPDPVEISEGVVLLESVEAKPKAAKEPTLKVAYSVIEDFLDDKDEVEVYQWPPRTRYRDYEDEEEDEYEDERDW